MTAGIRRISWQADHRKIPIIGLVAESVATAPSTPVNGQFYYDTAINRGYIREGGAWVLMSQTGAELLSNKGATNGYAALVSGTVPIAQIPTGTLPSTVALGNDVRLSDQRTPLDSSVTSAKIADGAITLVDLNAALLSQAANVESLRQLGFGATNALAGTSRLDQIAVPTTSVNLNSQKITSLLDPTNPQDAATKNYVDLLSQGFAGAKNPVRLAATSNVTLASPGATLDGLTMVAGERFLALNQTTTTQNGIYVWNGAAVAATRAPDDDAVGEVRDGTTVAVAEGTAQGRIYIQNATPSGAPGSWIETWTWYASAITYTASNGILLTGANFTAVKDTTDATNPITIGANGIGLGTVPVDHGGTGQTTTAGIKSSLGILNRYTVLLPALTAGVEVNVTHNLGTLYPLEPSLQLASDSSYMDLDTRVIDVNTVGVTSAEAYGANAVRVIVVG